MCDIFNFLWDQGVHIFFWNEKKLINCLLYEKCFYWVSCFKISVCCDNINQMNQLTRGHMWKCDKSKYLSTFGSVENNF